MSKTPPDALLLLATGCTHCAGVLEGLSRLLKEGRIGRLEAVNIVEHPEAAQAAGTRSVPWTRIGPFELEGALTPKELARWVKLSGTHAGFAAYYRHLLETRRPRQVSQWIARHPASLGQLIGLLGDDATPMAVRIGVGVVLEELEGSPSLGAGLEALIALAGSARANVRADAAHYLGLTHQREAAPTLRQLLTDDHPDVREIAREALRMVTNEEDTH